jgi:hypothetical protein
LKIKAVASYSTSLSWSIIGMSNVISIKRDQSFFV